MQDMIVGFLGGKKRVWTGLVLAGMLFCAPVLRGGQGEDSAGGAWLSVVERGGQVLVVWRTSEGEVVEFSPPAIQSAGHKEKGGGLEVGCELVDSKVQACEVEMGYGVMVGEKEGDFSGSYGVRMRTEAGGEQLVVDTELDFDEEVEQDIRVMHELFVRDLAAVSMRLAKINGTVEDELLFDSGKENGGYFALGRRAVEEIGESLVFPGIGLSFDWPVVGEAGGIAVRRRQLSMASDPYCGIQYIAGHRRIDKRLCTAVRMSTRYCGSLVPVSKEARRYVLRFGPDGLEGMFDAFYRTIPDIKPGAEWLHDIGLLYFDYLSDGGEGWYNDLDVLAEKVPEAYRSKVACCIHGWYDYIGRYAYDEEKGELLDEWTAFIPTRKIQMSKAEIHKRIKYGKDLGFRVLFYFGDGLNGDSGRPRPHPEWIYENERGQVNPHDYVWQGPDTVGKNFIQDPTVPALRRWFSDYLEALLEEYGGEVSGFVWDETFHISTEWISAKDGEYSYADRAMMTLVSRLTLQVQEAWGRNSELVFLVSDNVCPSRAHRTVPYCLVAHGTYQDSACNPACWPAGMLANYRNCIWSCNWLPRNPKGRERNRIATEQFGVPQTLSNGWYDDSGPSEMPEERVDEVIDRFVEWAGESR